MVFSRWTWLLAALLCTSITRADPVAPENAGKKPRPIGLTGAPSQIPAGGVLPLYGACSSDYSTCDELLGVMVTDLTTQAAVAGHVEIVRAAYGDAWAYFEPDVPFVEGTRLQVASNDILRVPGTRFLVAVEASTALSAASVMVDARLSRQRNVLRSECCPPLASMSARPRCLEVSVNTGALFAVSVTIGEPISTQYLFRLEVDDPDRSEPAAVSDFRPLARTTLTRAIGQFDGTAPRYCYSLRAQPFAGGAVQDLITECVDNDLRDLGFSERAPDEIEQWLETCEKPPGDAGVPDNGDEADGSITRDASDSSDERVSAGCQLATGTPASPTVVVLWSLVAWLLFARRKRSRAPSVLGAGMLRALGLCAAWCSPARAIVVPDPGLIYVVPEVPSDGVLVFYGVCAQPTRCAWASTIIVTDLSSFQPVSGTVSTPHPEGVHSWVTFTPDVPLRVGTTYRVADYAKAMGAGPSFEVRVSESGPLDLAAVQVTFFLTEGRSVLARECCPNIFDLKTPRCIETSVQNGALGQLRLSQLRPVATQWLYEVTVREPGEAPFAGDFFGSSLRSLDAQSGWVAPFDGTTSSYCYQVRAAPVVGGEVIVLDDHCVDNELADRGRVDRTPADIARFLDTCEKLPPVVDSGSPSGTDDTGASASSDDAAIVASPGDAGEGNRARTDGCQLAASQAAGAFGALWPALLVFRRRSKS